MRDIKFRAWDNINKKMIYPENIMFEEGFIRINFEPCYYPDGTSDWDFCIEGDNKLMQYIGLKDKNGVEIYEGDIVKHHMFDFYGPMSVKFGEHDTCIGDYYSSAAYGFFLQTPKNKKKFEYVVEEFSLPDEEIEVIGNIYEHPHLIKEDE